MFGVIAGEATPITMFAAAGQGVFNRPARKRLAMTVAHTLGERPVSRVNA